MNIPEPIECCATTTNYARPLQEIDKRENKIRNFNVQQLNYGYMVSIGCHTFAIETSEKLIEKISEYIRNPLETEDKWFKGELFK